MNSKARLLFGLTRFPLTAALAALLMVVDPQAHAVGNLEGQVIDQSTGKPVPGAIVVVTWGALGGGVGGSTQFCLHVESATADDQGRYRMPDWHGWWGLEHGLLWNRTKEFVGYKAGYLPVMSPLPTEKRIYLIPFTGTHEEWFKSNVAVNLADPDCRLKNVPTKRNLYRLDSAIANEAKRRATSPREVAYSARLQCIANDDLIDWSKPVGQDQGPCGGMKNADPAASFNPEELLK